MTSRSPLTEEELDEIEGYERDNCLRLIRLQEPNGRLDWQFSRKMLRSLISAARQSVWQPIETAPKDGTRILLAWPYAREGYWLDDSKTRYQLWNGWTLTAMDPWPQGQPTHWRPLPTPPSQGPSSEEGNTESEVMSHSTGQATVRRNNTQPSEDSAKPLAAPPTVEAQEGEEGICPFCKQEKVWRGKPCYCQPTEAIADEIKGSVGREFPNEEPRPSDDIAGLVEIAEAIEDNRGETLEIEDAQDIRKAAAALTRLSGEVERHKAAIKELRATLLLPRNEAQSQLAVCREALEAIAQDDTGFGHHRKIACKALATIKEGQ